MNRNSALRWFPAIEAAGLPVPRTLMVPYNHYDILPIFDGEASAEFIRLQSEVEAAALKVGVPAFLRTDLSSAKHSGPEAYCITDAAACGEQLYTTLEDAEIKFFMQRAGPEAMMVREFLLLDAPFTAFRGLPIAREWRIFADETHVICKHPYWPADALEDHISVEGWREQLSEMHIWPKCEGLMTMAVTAAKACGGKAWSVDFACDVAGKWWLIDMATMADSYHWPRCENEVTKGEQ
jgi:hypothetical protein